MKTVQFFMLCQILLPVLAPTVVVEAATSFTISDIGPKPSNGFFVPTSINSSGQVVGFVDGIPMQSFLISNADITNLGSLGGPATLAYGINDSGEITGHAATNGAGVPEHAFIYSNGTITDLGSLGQDSYGQAINNSGQITGYFSLDNGMVVHSFLYADGKMTDIGVLPGTTNSQAFSINTSGEIVGESYIAPGVNDHAFAYANGTMTDLGTLGGPMSGASAINDAGQIVGFADLPSLTTVTNGPTNPRHAFLYSDEAMKDLGTLGGEVSIANAINNLGQIVGESEITLGTYTEHAFLDENGSMVDLNSLIDPNSGWVLNKATGINDAGQIIGNGTYDGHQEAFLLTPNGTISIPEPALTVSIAGIGLLVGRKRKIQNPQRTFV